MRTASLHRNLLLGFSISMLILIISSTASFISIKNLLKSSERVDHSIVVVKEVDDVLSLLKDAETGQRGYLLTNDINFLEPYNGSYNKIETKIENLRTLIADNPRQQQYVQELQKTVVKRFEMLDELIQEKRNNREIQYDKFKEGKVSMDGARELVRRMEEEEHNLLVSRTENLNKFASFTPVLIVIAALIAIFITISFYLKVKKDIADKIKLQDALVQKDIETTNRINVIENIATKVSSGNFSVRVQDNEKDNLGSLSLSLNKMAESLERSFNMLADKEWLQAGIAGLNDTMIGDNSMKILTQRVLAFIIGYNKALVGAFYVADKDGLLVLQSTFALSENDIKKQIVPGEGLVGECAVSRQAVVVSDIPGKDISINFTSLNINPANIIIFPILFEDTIKGVIELGSLNTFSERQLEFFKTIGDNIGIAINTVENRQRVQSLLEETQAQAEELMTQHSELEHMNAELEAQTEELQTSEEELKVQQEELLETNSILEEKTALLEERNHLINQKNIEIHKKAEELALSTKYKSEFLANMSHELRTPLNSILLLSRLMTENNDKNLTPEQVQYAQVIQSSGNGLLELIDEILDLSKIEAGKMNMDISATAIEEIVHDMESLFTPIANQKNVEWKIVASDPSVPSHFETDKMRLEQILKNLLSNSFKFTQQGYVHLIIDVPEKLPDFIRFRVKDTGIGIAEEKQQLIFDAFQQEDGSTRRKYGGTGLGLSISRELSKMLGGRITLKSEAGKGSEFSLYVPISGVIINNENDNFSETISYTIAADEDIQQNTSRLQLTAEDIPDEIADDRSTITNDDRIILIIEDDTAFAKAILDYTRQKGYKGIVAVRGDRGIELAKQYRPAGVLLDIQLPVMNGWQVMDELKKNAITRHIPVHIMSSMEAKKESLLKGAIDFINKPLAFEQLNTIFEKIEYVLGKNEKKVLIIEENNKHAKALAYFLGTYNVNTAINHTVEESISSLHNKAVDCAILDMGVPDAKSYELLEKVKQNKELENIPIIIFTGRSLSHSEEFRIKQYADSIVLKTAHSYQRILDEVSIFLHLVEENKKASKTGDSDKLGILENVLKDKTVLLADDDVRNIFSMTKALEKYNMKIMPALDGKEALDLLNNTPEIDIILMDMMMPEMDGYETIKAIRTNPSTKRIPIIAVTAKTMTGDREKCIAAGASDYISKPVDIDQLVSLLRIWLYDKE